MAGQRLFIALTLPHAARTTLIARMGGIAGARWQEDAQLHCTVRFLGEIDGDSEDDVIAALGHVSHPPIDATLSGLGTFDRHGRIDTLWIGVSPVAEMRALHSRLDRALGLVGIPPDPRTYVPHVTLARFGRSSTPPSDLALALPPPSPVACRFDRLALYESRLGHEGASYDVIAIHPLR